jgi:hypothetical protein
MFIFGTLIVNELNYDSLIILAIEPQEQSIFYTMANVLFINIFTILWVWLDFPLFVKRRPDFTHGYYFLMAHWFGSINPCKDLTKALVAFRKLPNIDLNLTFWLVIVIRFLQNTY